MEQKFYELTNPQKSILYTDEFYQGTPINNVGGTLLISDPVDFSLLQKAIKEFILSNDALKIKVKVINDIPKQYLDLSAKDYPIEISKVHSNDEVSQIEHTLINTPFDLSDQFLFRFRIYQFEDGHGGFSAVLHHLISDAWSMSLLIDQIINIYASLMENSDAPVEANPSYLDYISSEKEYQLSEKFQKDKNFWAETFASLPEFASISTSTIPDNSSLAKRKEFILEKELTQKINEFCKKQKSSPFGFFMGLIAIYLSRVSNTPNVTIGTPILNRSNFKEKNTIGMYISTMPFSISVSQEILWTDFLKQISMKQLSCFRHQKYPYQLILQDIRNKFNNGNSLYDVALSYQNARDHKQTSSIAYTTRWCFNGHISDSLQLHISDLDDNGSLVLDYDYQVSQFQDEEIDKLHQRILHMINQIFENEQITISDLEIVTKEEKEKLIFGFNQTKMDYPKEQTIFSLFEKQVNKFPENTALTFSSSSITYRELKEKVISLAYILKRQGVKKGDIVAVYLDKSLDYIISILACLKLGATFMPISCDYPQERIHYLLENSEAKIILSKKCYMERISTTTSFLDLSTFSYPPITEDFETSNSPQDIAYIIYTSGSTGNPKGVLVSNQSLINHVYGIYERFEHSITQKDHALSIANISFDASMQEIFIPLLCGASVDLLPDDYLYNPKAIANYISQNQITFAFIPPTILEAVYEYLEKENSLCLNKLLVGVQSIKNTTLNRYLSLNPHMQIHNGYGPTEATICCISYMYHKTTSKDPFVVPIGKPMGNCEIYLLDQTLNLQVPGYQGEICIAGDCLSSGYLKNPDKNKESFVFVKALQKTVYRTGDYAYFLPNGDIKYVGRRDLQVKLNGFRIELSEIDNVISSFPNVKNAFTLITEDKKIASFIVEENSENTIDFQSLKNYLKKKLPYYMVPVYFFLLSTVPTTSNGKLDKKELEKILKEKISHYRKENLVLPSTLVEQKLLSIFCQTLKQEENKTSILDSFFEIGGDSLSAIRLSSEIEKEFNTSISVKKIFELETIQAIAKEIEKNTTCQEQLSQITKVKPSSKYPISSAQKRVFLACKMAGKNTLLYNMPGYIKLPNNIQVEKLQKAVDAVMQKHASLRTSFVEESTGIYQMIKNHLSIEIPIKKTSTKNLENHLKQFVKPFDLEKAPLFRLEILELEDNSKLLLLDMHHIISDGESATILVKDLCDYYNNQKASPLELQYVDYASWEINLLKKENLKQDEDYWLNQLSSFPVLDMPFDFSRPTVQDFKGKKYSSVLEKPTSKRIRDFCIHHNITPYMFLLAAYQILLAKYCRQEEIIVGSPVANRTPKTFDMIGMFVNNLVIKSSPTENKTIESYLTELKQTCLDAFEHQAYPFDEIVKKLNVKRNSNRNSIFDTMFIYQNEGNPNFSFENTTTPIYPIEVDIAKFDLSFEVVPQEDTMTFTIEYATSLFRKETIISLMDAYHEIILSMLSNDEQEIGKISIINEKQKEQILNTFNNTKTNYPRYQTVQELFEEQVEKTPDKIALVFEQSNLTYQELNQKANQLAHYLKSLGVKREDIVSILLDKSLESIISILAVLKAGAAYLPIDINYPKERIDYMIRDSKSNILLTTNQYINKANSTVQIVNISLDNQNIYEKNYETNNPINENKSRDLAYIMYTSGSTGNPKGTMIEHRSIIRLVKNTNFICFEKEERILQTGSIVFDACTFEIWGALLNGFELHVMKKETLLDSSYLQDYLISHKITILWLTAPLLNQLCEDNPHMFNSVRVLLTGGDVLSPKHINMIRSANPHLTIINGYGPTENTTFSTSFTIDKKYETNIPIGKPIANSTCYVVDKNLSLLPVGFAGELLVGGDGLARGYLNNPILTQQKFVKNPFKSGMVYKTGDLVRFLPDGNIEFLGRIDNQVKIRGFRVELSEINHKLSSYPGIKECATVIQMIRQEKTICSYFVSEQKIDLHTLQLFLKKSLPSYMIPSYFMQLEKLPINTNGKIDKNALPTTFKTNEQKRNLTKPQNKTQELLLKVFQKILNREDISIEDDFFDLGGDSLAAMRLQVEAISQGLNISYSDIFKHPSIIDLASSLTSQEKTNHENSLADYHKYDTILEKNKVSENIQLDYHPLGNVLLTGFTGFLGAHVLDSFLKNESGDIYCLIRAKNQMSAMDRLVNVLHFYFEEKYDKYIGNRIKLVEGDITSDYLGLSPEEYILLGNKIQTVIHCAALVKHYGQVEEFQKVNVIGTQNIIAFCKQFQKLLMHVSTISVSGNVLAEESHVDNNFTEDKYYDETNFYIGQNIENLYVKSKFDAEYLVLEAISQGLKAYILRMGNLTSRFTEGKFQQNHYENAFVNRFKSMLQIGCMPDYLLSGYAEFTPIDFCGDAIIALASHYNKNYSVFHLLNEKHLELSRLYKELNELGIPIKIVSSEKFVEIINELLQDENKKSYLEGIINDLDKDKKLVYDSNVKIKSDFTKEILQKIGFEWPYIDKKYIRNYLKYLSDIGYFNIKIN